MTLKKGRWNQREVALLQKHYPHKSQSELVEILGRDPGSIYRKAHAMGLKKNAEYMDEVYRTKITQNGTATRFRKGQAPWKKGVKGVTGLHENNRRNHFRPSELHGMAAKRIRPIGHEQINKDGCLERKVNNGRNTNKRWRAELMKLNSLHTNYPPELARLALLRGALNRQIRNAKRNQE